MARMALLVVKFALIRPSCRETAGRDGIDLGAVGADLIPLLNSPDGDASI